MKAWKAERPSVLGNSLLVQWFAALVAVVLSERGCSTEGTSESDAALHAELSTGGLSVSAGRTGVRWLVLWY